ncbi:PRTRC system protein A [Crenobacter sp. SG2305]|uniref:PRTRC system protein A n=1 Tax=Crenobacter oryzisoli TaxID=3056844 RepID=UPI0025AA4AC7|nr:PRTRC system protein A [Crenobacter sp. SG2305]MDN0082347.1 PRTRC system protein A [Crenobacter sp. SG2305]
MLNPLDAALQASAPVLMVPKFEPMTWLEESGHRFLLSANGLWLEVRRSWLHLVWPLAEQSAVAMPYGELKKRCQIAGGTLPSDLIRRFVAEAQASPELETAAWILWDACSQAYRYQDLEVIDVSEDHIEYHRPALSDAEELALDLHSHGRGDAYFSPKDDKDDRGEVKVSLVVGRCHTATPTLMARICAVGLFLNVPIPSGI